MNKVWFKNRLLAGLSMLLIFVSIASAGTRQAEWLKRGLICVRSGNINQISWRFLGHEPADTGFNIYRNGTKINTSVILNATFYSDYNGSLDSRYTVRAVIDGSEQEESEPSLNFSGEYYSIPISPPGPNHANDASVGDLDGDGVYEIILKWEADNAKDNSQDGYTDNVYLDAYKLDGTRMWRINLGRNIRAGAHYTQFMVYDLDGDGKAEVACKTADGTVDGANKVIGDANADYRNSDGRILSGPEFLTVFDGETGAALVTTDYIPARGNVSDWGDNYGNRVDRFLACIAYLDGERPSLVMCRGYYTRTVLAAWDFRNGQLTHRWTFDSDNGYSSYEGQGNHNLSVADVDQDGRDEIIYGSMAVDDNGSGLWNSRLGHGDAMHVADIDPYRPGLEVWGIHENASIGSALLDARTGAIIWNTGAGDVGRGVAADVNGSYVGMECWGGTDGLRSASNQRTGDVPSSSNFVIWWDGDLQRELLDQTYIDKYGIGRLLTTSGTARNNGTKANPCLSVDFWGDWREEVIFRTTDNQALRIYTSSIPTSHRFYTLMHDSVYRLGIAWQNVAYNQPPHTGFYLGGGMGTPPRPDIYYPNAPLIKPQVVITSPGNNQTFTTDDEITINVTASDQDGSIDRVTLYINSDSWGSVTAAPYTFRLGVLPEGSYTVYAEAVDNEGNTGRSAEIQIRVQGSGQVIPEVHILSPANNAVFTPEDTIAVDVSATDGDGTVESVTLYINGVETATITNGAYEFVVGPLSTGTYTIRADAVDNDGNTGTSGPLTITVREQGETDVSVSWTVSNSWESNGQKFFQADVIVANGGTEAINWALDWTFPGEQKITTNFWNVVLTQTGASVHAEPSASWNSTIYPGGSINFGAIIEGEPCDMTGLITVIKN